MKVIYNLPKKYLSYSQMSLWQSNREGYRQRYYFDGPSFVTREILFGKRVAHMLENGIKDPVLDRVPRYKLMEHRIEVKVGGVPFLGVLDSFSKQRKAIVEYKTGKEAWNDLRCAKANQLVIYSLLTKVKYKKVDPWVRLVWIETRDGKETREFGGHTLIGKNNQIEFTGKIQVFKRRISEWQRAKMQKQIIKIAKEISDDYTKLKQECPELFQQTGEALAQKESEKQDVLSGVTKDVSYQKKG